MKPIKLMEREYATPMLGGGILPMMNEAMSLGFSFKMMVLVAAVSCIYAGLRIWNKNVEIKYGSRCGSCGKAAPAKPDTPPAATP